MDMLGIVGLIAIGFVAGTLGSVLGLGGGFLVVPALILLRGLGERTATGTSIAVIVPAMLVALWSRGSQGHVDFGLAAWLAAGAVVGSLLGSHLSGQIDGLVLRRMFAGVLVLLAAILLLKK